MSAGSMRGNRGRKARTLAERLVTAVLGVPDVAMRASFVAVALREHPREAIAEALDLVCQGAEQAEPEAREALASIVQALLDPTADDVVQELREEAAGRPLLALDRLLHRPAHRGRATVASEPAVPDYGTGRPLTLGERKALARKPDRASFDRLLRDPDPSVIRTLLRNPKLTEDDVIRLASRRPANAAVNAEIARDPRWSTRARIRMALVLNPGTPVDIAVPLVPLLVRHELRLVVQTTETPAPVRAAARELLLRRPPKLGRSDDGEGNAH